MAFTARQVTHHRREAQEARQIALTMKALGPFVAELTDTDQQAVRREIARHIFRRRFGADDPLPAPDGDDPQPQQDNPTE